MHYVSNSSAIKNFMMLPMLTLERKKEDTTYSIRRVNFAFIYGIVYTDLFEFIYW